MTAPYTPPTIDEYLRKRLMPVEGAIPHLQGIEMYGSSIPAGTVGGDLFEYINFQQRYDIDARIQRALKRSQEYVEPLPVGALPRNSVDDHVEWLKSRSGNKFELEESTEPHEVRSRSGSPKICASCTALREFCWSTPKGTESFQRKSRPPSTTRFMHSCFQNSITEEKRRQSYLRGSTCGWPCRSRPAMRSAGVSKRTRRRSPLCFTVRCALMGSSDS